MTQEVAFLFDGELVASVINLIRSSKNKLLLIAPFIDMDKRVMDALLEKRDLLKFELRVLYGKQENGYQQTNRDSFEFLKQFPDVEIRYDERLKAKFYLNDYEYIMTSLGLYDYSLNENIEVGVLAEYASRGIFGKALDVTSGVIGQGVDKVKQEVIGYEKSMSPIEKFQLIFDAAELQYKTRPLVGEKGGLKGLMGGKKLDGFEIVVDNLRPPVVNETITPSEPVTVFTSTQPSSQTPDETFQPAPTVTTANYVSAAHLSSVFGVQIRDINNLMQRKGFIQDNTITTLGYAKGLVMQNYMGTNYIAYPENMEELNEFRL